NLDWADFKRMPIIIPPYAEQRAITLFLSDATRRIDQVIRAKKRVISLLNEEKQKLVYDAILGGIAPISELQPLAGSWLARVPAHWNVLQLRRMVSLVTSGSRGWAKYYSDDGCIFLQSGNLGRSMALNLGFVQHVSPPHGVEGQRTRVQRDDILICITGGLTG